MARQAGSRTNSKISRTVDFVRVDLMGVDLVGVDLVRVDLEAPNRPTLDTPL